MDRFYASLIFIGIILIVFSFILILLEKKNIFSFTRRFEEKKKELIEIINDAELMIEELNKFSDYVVTQMDLKNEELSANLSKANEELTLLNQKAQAISSMSEEAKISKCMQAAEEVEAVTEMAVNGDCRIIPINSRHNEVLKLSRNGLSDYEIARRLNIGKGEIQLILELNR